MNEEWKAVPGYEGIYYVSNLGRILVKKRIVERTINGTRSEYELPERILTGTVDFRGYIHVRLSKPETKIKLFKIHSLVVRVFLGNYDSNLYEVHHKDGNRKNNRLDNLLLLTKDEHRKLHKKLGRKAFLNVNEKIIRKVKKKFKCIETRRNF